MGALAGWSAHVLQCVHVRIAGKRRQRHLPNVGRPARSFVQAVRRRTKMAVRPMRHAPLPEII
ncbi:hypothetical protein PUN4_410033 [Paraburkholderia unamae]|nr:hypothetical protein PUN4_410033 [Paraburkholderia unamae]